MTRNEQIDGDLASHYEAARAEWPDVVIEYDEFAAYVTDRLAEPGSLRQLHTSQLYLACACARRDPAALRAFERTCTPIIHTSLAQLRGLGADADDVAQLVLQKVLVGEDPKIVDYNGSGDLRGWLKAVALRTGLNYLRKRKREIIADDDDIWMALPVTGMAPGLAELRTRYRAHFKAALPQAIAALPPQDRAVLRYHYLDGLNLDQIGKIYGVHRSTASRWVDRACGQLVERVRAALRDGLKVSDLELASIVEMIRSELDLSLTGYFAAAARMT